MQLGDMMKRLLRGGAKSSAPQHYSGARVVSARAFSHARSLTAAAVALAMMATVAVSALLPTYSATADDGSLAGSTCTPTSIGLGDDTSITGSDTGVATYVGGDMYVGGKPSNADALNSATGPTGTYAVEAEGLTVVNGSLAMNPKKSAWRLWNTGSAGGTSYVSRGFRWGVVGFGSQFRPADGKVALAVGGNTSTSVMGSKVGAWTAPGWLGKTSSTDATAHGYTASLAGGTTQVWGQLGVDSVRGLSGKDTTTTQPPVLGVDSNLVVWDQSNNLSNVNGTDYSAYKSKIAKLSEDLDNGTKLPATGTVTTGTAPSASNYTIYKYDYRKNGNTGNSFMFYDDLDEEKLITFTSTDTSKSMQVFNLPASDLNLSGTDYTGIDFKFVNVPDNASVVINVTGANGQTIDFHNGWRFWWKDDNIANDFVTAASGDADQAEKNTNYAKRAQQLMWNFADASNVVIRGGQARGKITVGNHNADTKTNHGAWGTAEDMQATDDPSAAWMGSILVPKGNLQSHVSTNGRVWVGGDFEMLNNETVKRVDGQSSDHAVGSEFVNESGEKTTSILDMDQERHNLPWNGSYSTSCAAIAWDKVDDTADHNSLGGTSWTVYGTKDNAVAGTNALATIADGGWNDDADAAVVQAGAMQWTVGHVEVTTGVKGVGDFIGKLARGAVTNESAVKPEYVGNGVVVLEPTYRHVLLLDPSQMGGAITVNDGLFYACETTIQQHAVMVSRPSAMVAGGEGLFNLSLMGQGTVALESPVPASEIVTVDLENDELKVDGNFAIAWTNGLQFTVERSTKTLIGSAASGEGLVNVYRGTGRVLLAPVAANLANPNAGSGAA